MKNVLIVFMSLFTLFNPPAAIAPFIHLAGRYSAQTQHRMALRIAVSYAGSLIAAIWVGRPLLRMLGISLPALRMAGGFVLLLAALPMATRAAKNPKQEEDGTRVNPPNAWSTDAAVPLTFPISVGGATLATVITAGDVGRNLVWSLVVSLVCLGMAVVVWLTFRFSAPLARRLGDGGLSILTTIGGIILLCIAFQILASAVTDLLPPTHRPGDTTG